MPCLRIIEEYVAQQRMFYSALMRGFREFWQMIKLDASQYEPLLKDSLCCWRCDRVMESMPRLKVHLQEEFDKLTTREKAKLERKRKRTDVPTSSVQASVLDDERPEKVARLTPSQDDGSNMSAVGGDLQS
jgi:aprataxin